jgi:hypothetical protein
VRHSTLIRAELEDAVAVLTPAARAVFEDIKRMDEDAGSQLPEGFDALTPPERTSVIGAAKLLDELAKVEEAEDLERSEDIFPAEATASDRDCAHFARVLDRTLRYVG